MTQNKSELKYYEHPIIFNSEMVRAILEGRKTQTRRPINPQFKPCEHKIFQEADWKNKLPEFFEVASGQWACRYCGNGIALFDGRGIKCPFGKIGDRLWVRETWTKGEIVGGEKGEGLPDEWYVSQCINENNIIYKEYCLKEDISIDEVYWIRSIHMPRWASRITLEITNIRVERVQDITKEDILSEGIIKRFPKLDDQFTPGILRGQYIELWNSIYVKKYPWNSNPWVWVIEFKVLKGGLDAK